MSSERAVHEKIIQDLAAARDVKAPKNTVELSAVTVTAGGGEMLENNRPFEIAERKDLGDNVELF